MDPTHERRSRDLVDIGTESVTNVGPGRRHTRTKRSLSKLLPPVRLSLTISSCRAAQVASNDFPGYWPHEDHSWNEASFREVSGSETLALINTTGRSRRGTSFTLLC